MKFGEITDHLGMRGFVTRKKWCREYGLPETFGKPKCVMVFGVDNVGWIQGDGSRTHWIPCLDDITADDWIILPFFWNGTKDDFLPIRDGGHPSLNLVHSGCRGQSAYAFSAYAFDAG